MKKNQSGFGMVEVFMSLLLLGLIGVAGWQVMRSNNSPPKTSKTTTTTADKYLVLDQFGVELKLNSNLANATYKLITPKISGKLSAFLSTKELDDSSTCQAYYTDPDMPSFQYIEQYSQNEQVTIGDSDTVMTASEAAKANPESYKTVGSAVYAYKHGNGMPCPTDTDNKISNAFADAFATLQTYQTSASTQ